MGDTNWFRQFWIQGARRLTPLRTMFIDFLGLIGLYPENRIDPQAQLDRFRRYHDEFLSLITANNRFLQAISRIEDIRHGQAFFDFFFIGQTVVKAVGDVVQMVESLNRISQERYHLLRTRMTPIIAELSAILDTLKPITSVGLVIDIHKIMKHHSSVVGAKMTNLGEIHNQVNLPTPDGFAVSTEGYWRVIGAPGGLESPDSLRNFGESKGHESDVPRTQDSIQSLPIPAEVGGAILAGYERLAQRLGFQPSVAVRSSALGEDSRYSFAGQFCTELYVGKDGLIEAYKKVLASIFSPEAVHYRRMHKISDDAAAMAVGFVSMIDAVVSGVVFSREPARADSNFMIVHCVRGLGVTLVDGRTSPEIIRLVTTPELRLVARTLAQQTVLIENHPISGTREHPIAPEEYGQPLLSDQEALKLARWALILEEHFQGPQDIEWAMDSARNIFLLQSRPLRLSQPTPELEPALVNFPLLVSGGEAASPGVGSGPAFHLADNGDMNSFPEGSVLIAPRSSPKYVQIMSRARAIVTDIGSTTGHMASLAREFRVPAILNTKIATKTIRPGQVITVDARHGYIYDGVVPELLGEEKKTEDEGRATVYYEDPNSMALLAQLSDLLRNLTLTDPQSERFRAENCQSLHDIARYVHEKSYEEMFKMGDNLGDLHAVSYKLDVRLPIDLYVIDLGGGIKPPSKGRNIGLAQVISGPLRAILTGMMDSRIRNAGPKPMDMSGLVGIMMRHAISNPEQERGFSEPCYVLVSDRYLNYTSRVGYHFSVLDSYCGETPNKNYISFLFQGGASDLVRRNRRVRALAGILSHFGFSIELESDKITARISKISRSEIQAHLEMFGRLLQFFRQLDVAMTSEAIVTQMQEAFISGNYQYRAEQSSP